MTCHRSDCRLELLVHTTVQAEQVCCNVVMSTPNAIHSCKPSHLCIRWLLLAMLASRLLDRHKGPVLVVVFNALQ